MTDDAAPQYRAAGRAEQATSAGAVGLILFAAVMMIMVGFFQVLAGLVAIINNAFYAVPHQYAFRFNVTTWGWIDLLIGLIVLGAGWGLLSGRTWARLVGITIATLSAIANFLFLPYYPFWTMTVIALDVFVIWAIAAHGGELRDRAV
jgi:hypothetical protein